MKHIKIKMDWFQWGIGYKQNRMKKSTWDYGSRVCEELNSQLLNFLVLVKNLPVIALPVKN